MRLKLNNIISYVLVILMNYLLFYGISKYYYSGQGSIALLIGFLLVIVLIFSIQLVSREHYVIKVIKNNILDMFDYIKTFLFGKEYKYKERHYVSNFSKLYIFITAVHLIVSILLIVLYAYSLDYLSIGIDSGEYTIDSIVKEYRIISILLSVNIGTLMLDIGLLGRIYSGKWKVRGMVFINMISSLTFYIFWILHLIALIHYENESIGQ